MPRIASTANENKLISDKVNFFIDWFNYFIQNKGAVIEFEIENPLSLIDKILFQLSNGDQDKGLGYISNYFSHNFFVKDEYLMCFSEYEALKAIIVDFSKSDKTGKKKIISDSQLTRVLSLVQKQLQEDMFRFSLNAIISYFHCNDNIEKHKKDIKYHTQIIISEYLFQYRNSNDLEEILERIVNKELDKFPFPSSIKTKKQKIKYLSNVNLQQQFEGLLNWLYTSPSKVYYIFKVYGAEFSPEISFKYSSVTFYSKEHKMFTAITEKLKEKSIYFPFFNENQKFILAALPVEMFSEESSVTEGRKNVETELRYLGWRLNVNLIVDTTNNYLHTSNFKTFGHSLSTQPLYKKFHKNATALLKDNPFFVLKKINSPAIEYFLSFEYLYVNAMKYKNVADLWHYLEVLLKIDGQKKEIKNQVSTIILDSELFVKEQRILSKLYFELSPVMVNKEMLGITFESAKKACAILVKGKLPKLLRKIKYPFIQELITSYDYKLTKEDYVHAKNYYFSILSEAYEQRNFLVHQANTNRKAVVKLDHSFYEIIKRLRWVIISEIKRENYSQFSDLINVVTEKGKSYYTL